VTIWRRSDRVLFRLVLDDVVLLPLDGDGEPFALAGGRTLWEALSEGAPLDQLAVRVGASGSEADLQLVLEGLVGSGVVERSQR